MGKVSLRIRLSRRLGRGVMLCARADWHRWRVRRLLNLLFAWRERNHCADAADWEAFVSRPEPPDFVAWARDHGLL